MRKFILPTSISDMQALFIDMNNRIEELEAIEAVVESKHKIK